VSATTSGTHLDAKGITVERDGRLLADSIDVDVPSGTFVGLLGPNGSGKSTLLKSIYRVVRPNAGMVRLDGQDMSDLDGRALARRLAVVAQESDIVFELTVRELVLLGRIPHKGNFERDSELDHAIVADCLAQVGMADAMSRIVGTLSGGEKQRVLVARALAQQPEVLVLDEPTNHLDIRHQLELLDLVRGLGLTTFAALHDLNLAAEYCDHLYVLDGGRVVGSGTPAEVLTAEMIRSVFRIHASFVDHPLTGRRHLLYLSHQRLADASSVSP